MQGQMASSLNTTLRRIFTIPPHLRRLLSQSRLFGQATSQYQRFLRTSLLLFALAMPLIGWWISWRIETGVLNHASGSAALYIESFISPVLSNGVGPERLSTEQIENLEYLLNETPLGREVVGVVVWGRDGRVLYSTDPNKAGMVFPLSADLHTAWRGQTVAEWSDVDDVGHVPYQEQSSHMLAVYTPVRHQNTNEVMVVVEFYEAADSLQQYIATTRRQTWLGVFVAGGIIFVLLARFVRHASDTIDYQKQELSDQVTMLTSLLAQNIDLHQHVSNATARATDLNERYLRRIGSDLHDGPAQNLGLALLHLDRLNAHFEDRLENDPLRQDAEAVQHALSGALQEIRSISLGLGMPELQSLTLAETVTRVVKGHERRTSTSVAVNFYDLPDHVNLPIKIVLYRLIQEALNNAFRHGGGVGQQVVVRRSASNSSIEVEVRDAGPGFVPDHVQNQDDHLGLAGMRGRVEVLGGAFRVESMLGVGTLVYASLPLRTLRGHYEFADPARDSR